MDQYQPTPPRSPPPALVDGHASNGEKEELCQEAAELDAILRRIHTMAVAFVQEGKQSKSPVVRALSPSELAEQIDFMLPEGGLGLEGIWPLVDSTLKYSVNSWNPRFMDKLYASTNPIGVLSELLLAILNVNVHVYHVSPVVTMMEIQVCKQIGQLIGFGSHAGGLVCPGGSASNLLSVITARNVKFPHIKQASSQEGYRRGEVLTMFTSAHGHYSVDKAGMAIGIGTNQVVKVPCDEYGRIIPSELERCIQESLHRGETPFYVNATAGTTVMAAFDPFEAIGAIARRYNLWYHVDGSYGGSIIFSEHAASMASGLAMADSFTINPHKMLGVPLQCSLLIVHNQQVLCEANAVKAGYLFHGNIYDLGDGGIGCGRRGDALKMFLAWKYYGAKGFGRRIDRSFELARYFANALGHRSDFCLVGPNGTINVCFCRVTRTIHARVNHSGEFQIDHAPLPGKPLFFRIPMHPAIHERDIDALIDTISRIGTTIDEGSLD
ncbi:pyridoxal phosphate-dependent transferase [Syncephalis pseudoplumigaleata]|uniref:Pyridoxal phosphate-dependent transferase n=1 Tax=Syncephalis pseudoplumigaleata TaxID=1712513 RepID=A0A4P9YXY7_9FUNG|nr:pyridoxal phosphate-dependent transferase [Syncephalis pseudoplumigaleata]|eukprot:RKP25003.1 pyridoxal phosphate-dependent transferase [Syncephalis pseudoplumigaleata]